MEIDIKPGDVIREYRFERPIGSGAYGTVWQAHHTLLDAPAAIKVIDVRDLDPRNVERVKRECQIGGRLTHQEHVVEVRNAFEENEWLFIVMELTEGGSLTGYLRECPYPDLRLTLKWALDLCSALEEVHELGIIHRDIKPENILLTHQDEVKLGDFGVAHLPDSGLTTAYQPGTPAYRAPEQEANEPVDGRTDVYALCAVFFEVWSGRKYLRFRGQDPEIGREELTYQLDERYAIAAGARDRVADLTISGLRPRAARASLAELKAELSSIRDEWGSTPQAASRADSPIRARHARYLSYLADAYRAFFRDRFVHQAMDAVEVPFDAEPDTGPSTESPGDPLMVEFVALLDQEERGEREAQGDFDEIETRPIRDLGAGLAQYEAIALLGAPGAGKTSALLWLLGTWQETQCPSDRLPVFVSLSRYNEGAFEDFLGTAWMPSLVDGLRAGEKHREALEVAIGPLARRLREYLAEGQAVLLLDALNELPRGPTRQERLDRLRCFVKEATELGNWVVVSCRRQDYVEALHSLQRVEIRPFDDTRIQSFLNAYLGADRGQELWSILGKPHYARLRELIRNPFLLAGLTSIRQRAGGALPTVRAALLDRLAALSIGWERRKKPLNWVSRAEQEKVLGALALAMTALGKTIVNKVELANRLPDAWFFEPARREPLLETVLRLAQGARLARWTPGEHGGTVTFEHQVWQEYYGARLLARMDDPELRGLARHAAGSHDASTAWEILRPKLHDPSWRNVILMTASQMSRATASAFISEILRADSRWEEHLYRDARLAAACLNEGARTGPTVVDDALDRLKEARGLDIQPLTQLVDEARVELLIAEERFARLITLTQDATLWWETRMEIVESMVAMGHDDKASKALQKMAHNEQLHRKTRREAAEMLEEIDKTEAAIRAWSALADSQGVGKGIRRIARQALRRLT